MNTNYASASLYVGDLQHDVTEAMLFELFNQVGPVASIRVCRDAHTRRSLGYAYVNFHQVVDAERALDTLNYTTLKGKPCRIMWSHRDPSVRRSQAGNIFIKNLDKSIDNKVLYDTFSQFGNILSCKVCTDERDESKGYGFVHYETTEAAESAIAKVNGMLLNGKKVFVGPFLKRGDRGTDGTVARFTNTYVKNLPEETDSDALREMFAKYGKVTSAVVMTDANGKSRGFGFVNFEKPEEAKAAVDEMNESTVGDKSISVCRAQKKHEREAELRKKFEAQKQERISKYQGVNLFVKNLDETVDDDVLRTEFTPFGTISSAKVMKDDKGISKGFGFVCFTTPEEATKAITEMNNKMINNKPIYVALAQRKDARRAQLEAQHQQRQGGMRQMGGMPGQPGPMYPGGPMFYASQPGMVQPRQGYFPQQQMGGPRGGPGGRWPGGPQGQMRPGYGQQMGPNGYPMQPGMQQGRQQRAPRNGPGGRGMNQPGAPQQGMKMQPGQQARGGAPVKGQQQRGQFQYTDTARNRGMMQQGGPQHAGMPTAPGAMIPGMPGQEALTASALADAPPPQQKQMLGERLFPLIQQSQPELAGKITGMLLEMENGELLHLLESPEALLEKITEALEVLHQHTATAGLEGGEVAQAAAPEVAAN